MKTIEKKRLVTNSMIGTFRSCRWKYWFAYIEALKPAKDRIAPSRGNLFHDLMKGLYAGGNEFDHRVAIMAWRTDQLDKAQQHYEQTKAMFGLEDEYILDSAEESADEISKEVEQIYLYYLDNVYVHDMDEYDVVFNEQSFEVPIVDRADRRHPRWRFGGKWDLVLRSKDTGRTFIMDHKLTAKDPQQFISEASLSTQPIAYTWAAKYLSLVSDQCSNADFELARKEMPEGGASCVNVDGPCWPKGVEAPTAFVLSVTRRKVPKKPTPVKKGDRLSKTSMKDTTVQLLLEAIIENQFDEKDYAEEIDRLKRSGPRFHLREEVEIEHKDIERWMEEVRLTCEEVLRVERFGRERLYRADPLICQSQYMKKCVYWQLCYGDYDMAIVDFIQGAAHSELAEQPSQSKDEGETLDF